MAGNADLFEIVADVQVGLTWSDAPLAAVYSRPYVVALMPNHIEIRSAQHISQQGLAQVRQLCTAPHCMGALQCHLSHPCQASLSLCPLWCSPLLHSDTGFLLSSNSDWEAARTPTLPADRCRMVSAGGPGKGLELGVAQRRRGGRYLCGVCQRRCGHHPAGAPPVCAAGARPGGAQRAVCRVGDGLPCTEHPGTALHTLLSGRRVLALLTCCGAFTVPRQGHDDMH